MQFTTFQPWFQGVRIFSYFPNEQPLGQNPPTHPQQNIVCLGKTVHKNGPPLKGKQMTLPFLHGWFADCINGDPLGIPLIQQLAAKYEWNRENSGFRIQDKKCCKVYLWSGHSLFRRGSSLNVWGVHPWTCLPHELFLYSINGEPFIYFTFKKSYWIGKRVVFLEVSS